MQTVLNQKHIKKLFSYCCLVLFSLPVFTLLGCLLFESWHGIIYGCGLFVFAIVLHLQGNKSENFYKGSIFFTSVATGLSISAYYNVFAISFPLFTGFLSAAVAAGTLLFVFFLIVKTLTHPKSFLWLIGLCYLIFCILSVVYWVKTGWVFFSFLFFTLLCIGFYGFAAGASLETDTCNLRYLSFAGFGSFAVITIVVVFIVLIAASEGDILDFGLSGLEPDWPEPKNKPKNQN